ncbi:3-oxoacyl-ACP reductase, partial [Klebsiella pneumoniae]|nr:3-oxoacyl-ACP reductase [Klebsiella pneumoniae]
MQQLHRALSEEKMDLNLTNRTAIVTGGATGLGREF